VVRSLHEPGASLGLGAFIDEERGRGTDTPAAPDRKELTPTFDSVADRYQQARPDYPEELYDTLIAATGITPGDRLLEVGCATGKATLPLARRGFDITCIEIGPDLARAARRNLAAYPTVTVIDGAFETWRPPSARSFDLAFAATAWHWLDPEIRYVHAWELLRPAGHLAFWNASHVFPEGGDPFFADIQDVYEEIGEGAAKNDVTRYRPADLPDSRAEIERSGLFEVVLLRRFDWEGMYTADSYIRLLDTFSGHIAMAPWQRDRLYGEIRRRLANRPDGRLRRHWGAVLNVARRLEPSEVHS
jgi:SAM-dependent methyltransferase